MSTVARGAPSDYAPVFRFIPNLAIEPLAAQVPAQAAAGATVSTVCGMVPAIGTNPAGVVTSAAGAKVKRVTFIPTAAITGVATNNFTLNVLKKTPGVTAVTVATLTFAAGQNANAFEFVALTLQAASTLLLAATDSVYCQQVQNGTGLACPAGVVQVDIEPIAPF